MIVSWNGTARPNNECSLVIEQTPYFGERGRRAGVTKRITIDGLIQGASYSTVALITTAIEELEELFSEDGGDLILYDSDGTTETAHAFRSQDTIGGLRVVGGVRYPEGKRGDYSAGRGRKWQVVIEGDFPNGNENLIAWVETLSHIGVAGAPDWLHVPVINGPWPIQEVSQFTPVMLVQRGKAIGQFDYPPASPPLFPLHEKFKLRQMEKKLPDRYGSGLRNWEIGWAYTFESMQELDAESQVP